MHGRPDSRGAGASSAGAANGGVAVLGALTRAISAATTLSAIYDAALDALEAGLGVSRASILLFDEEGVMRFHAWRGLSDEYRSAVEGHSPWRPDSADADILVIANVETEQTLKSLLPQVRAEGIRAMAFVPLVAGGVIGRFMLHFEEPRDLDASEHTLSRVIAAQTAAAVQRVRAEEEAREREVALQRSERHVRTLINATPECVKTIAADGTLLEMNAAGLELIEAPDAQAVIGHSVFDLIAPEHRDAYAAFHQRVCSGEAGTLEFEIVGLRGTRRVLETHAVPLRAGPGRFIHLAITRDATVRRKTEDAIRESEALFRQLADSLPQIIFMARGDGRPDYYNQRWYEFTGASPDAEFHETWVSIMHPADLEQCTHGWLNAVKTGQPYEVEARFFQHASGTYRWHLGRAVPVRDADGRITRWFGTATDIDDQKRAEQASRFLARASRTLSALVDSPTALQSVAALAVPDFADWCAADVLEADGSVRRLALEHWDRSKEEATRDIERRYPSRTDDPYGSRAVLRTGRPQLISRINDAMLVRLAHDEHHLQFLRSSNLRSMMSVPLRVGSQIYGALTFVTSDSGRHYGSADLEIAQELALRASISIENARLVSDLKQADRQKDEFLAVLAHELRNPLAPIRTALQLLRLAPDDHARRERAWMVMDRQLDQLVRLVDDLLDVSRITRGKIQLQKAACELAPIVQAAIETSRPEIEAGRHELAVTFPAEPIMLDADATRLAQVFSNLLNNAAKYTPPGGRIAIEAERAGASATVRVTDTGIGIPSDMLSGIFDMFTQVDRSIEKTHGGLGIGLTLAKRLIEMHGGTIAASSDGPGTGSEFTVSLPARLGAAALAAPGEAPQPSLVRLARRILVVDDNADAVECLAEMLRVQGHEVATAHDGVAAIDLAGEFRPDVVLLDIGMPRLSGYETARRLRGIAPGALLVAVTGWGQEEHRRRSREVGFDHHLVKPVDPADLDALLAQAFDQT